AAPEARRLTADGRLPTGAAFLAYVAAHLTLADHGQPCASAAPPRMVGAAAGYLRAELAFACADGKALAITSTVLADKVPGHLHFAQIHRTDGAFAEDVLSTDQPTAAIAAAGQGPLATAGLFAFIGMGMMHIFTGVDHMSFLVGLVLLSRRLRDLLFVVTGFTLGHSLTLALAVTGLIRPHAEYIDALVALTIALIGAENASAAAGRPATVALAAAGGLLAMAGLRLAGIGTLPPLLLAGMGLFAPSYILLSAQLADAGRVRLVVTLVFGLIHGFGFAADLLENRLPAARLAEILLGFNLGVELAQLAIVSALVTGTAWLVRHGRALPRALVADAGAAGLVGLGTFWFIARSFA
ncbi:MAG TPA: HupE/UreJ family protein, partial [Novosphingobium sp.]|nr:HupE/UreJ family protein [Novosphingobium sp.]